VRAAHVHGAHYCLADDIPRSGCHFDIDGNRSRGGGDCADRLLPRARNHRLDAASAERLALTARKQMMAPEYLAQRLTPYPLATKDGGVLHTIADARAYMLALPKTRKLRAHWQLANRLFQQEAGAAALTRQVHLALFMDGKLAPQHTSSARRWQRHTAS
jgi:hypothetical protein